MNIAVLGTGFIGQTHAMAINNSKELTLSAIVDINEVNGLAEKFNTTCYKNAEEMLKKADVDIVDICLPTFLHEEYVVLAAKYKKHILCEKPVTLTLESMDRMIAATKKADVKFMVAQVIRFWPEYEKIKEMYDCGDFGEIKMVYANRLAEHPKWTQWHKNPQNSGGGLFDLHTHDIDYAKYILGKVKTVYAVGWKSETGCFDHIMTSLVFINGVKAVIEGAFDMTENYPFTMNFRVVGQEQTVEYVFSSGHNLDDKSSFKRSLVLYTTGQEPCKIDVNEKTDSYQKEIEYFAKCIKNNEDVEVIPIEDSRYVIKLMVAIQKSLETGLIIEVL